MDYLEIDLHDLLTKILAKWYWIVAIALVFAVGGFLLSFLQPDIYEAKASFATIEPRFVAKFSQYTSLGSLPDPKESAIKSLILSDEIVMKLYTMWESPEKADQKVSNFKACLEMALAKESNVVTLSIRLEDPQQAALLVNTWAELAIDKVQEVFFGVDVVSLAAFEPRIDDSSLGQESRLVLENQLQHQFELQTQALSKLEILEMAKFDLEGLLAQLSAEPDTSSLDESYRLSFLLIQSRIYEPLLALDYDFDNAVETKTVGDFITILDNVLFVVESQISALQTEQTDLLSNISKLQAQLRYLENETLLSRALVPDESLSHHTVRNTVIGGAAGGFLALAGVLIADWWRVGLNGKEEETV